MYRLLGARSQIAFVAILGLVAACQVPTSSRLSAQAGPSDPECRYTRLPPNEKFAKALPRALCERTSPCREALKDWVDAFNRNEKAKKDLFEKRQELFNAEMNKPAVRDALPKLKQMQAQLTASMIGSFADTPALKLAADAETAQQTPTDANLEKIYPTARNDLSADKFLADHEKQVGDRLALVKLLRSNASGLLQQLAGFSAAANSQELILLERKAKAADTCFTEVEKVAKEAGVDVTSARPEPPTGGGGNTVRVLSATFGELGTNASCDALTKAKTNCEFSLQYVYKNTGDLASKEDFLDAAKKPLIEERTLPVQGSKPVCTLASSKALCGGGDGPGQPGKQQVKVTWTCGTSAKRFCRTWNAGEEVTMICDGSDTYACDAQASRSR